MWKKILKNELIGAFVLYICYTLGTLFWILYRNGYEAGATISTVYFIIFWAVLATMFFYLLYNIVFRTNANVSERPKESGLEPDA